LWRLQTVLGHQHEQTLSEILLVEQDWIHFRTSSMLSTDVMAFEKAYAAVKGKSGFTLSEIEAQNLELAIQHYRGDLLENWYQDWCLYERERLHQIYLVILDKLMSYCEAHGRYEEGLSYGRQILQYDRAREHSHRHMMRLYVRSGNRTGALRQYSECVATLKDEFDVEPSERTNALYKRIRASRRPRGTSWQANPVFPREAMSQVLRELHDLQVSLADMQRQIGHAAQAAELALKSRLPISSDQQKTLLKQAAP
jgi:DNA-binding SARP family transcriptional activator